MSDEMQPDPVPAAGVTDDPFAGDEEEFARLSPPRPRRRPLLALAVIAVAALVLYRLADDAGYALQPDAPAELGEARTIKPETLTDNRYVTVSGLPDRRNALLFEPRGDAHRRAFYRLLGTGSALLVHAAETSTPRPRFEDRFSGRLRRFDQLSYADQLREYFARRATATRFLDLAGLRARLGDPALAAQLPARLADRGGEPVTLGADADVYLEVDFPDELLVSLPKRQFPVEEDARHELARLGFPLAPLRTYKDGFIYVVRVPAAQRDSFLQQVDARGFPFSSRRERYVAHLGELAAGPLAEQLSLPVRPDQPIDYEPVAGALAARTHAGRTSIDWSRVASVQVPAPIVIPEHAWLLVEGDRPADHTWVLALGALLAAFIAFNAWLLARSRRPATASEAAA